MENKIPRDWQVVKFGEVVNKINDKIKLEERSKFKRFVAGEHIDENEIRITKSAPIEGNEEVIGSAFHMRFKPGHVLYVSRRAYLRKAGIVDFEGICSNVSFILEAKKDKLLQKLLPFILQTEDFVNHAISNSHGSTNPFLNWKDIASFDFILPPLKEQERMVDILWAIEETLHCSNSYLKSIKDLKKKVTNALLLKLKKNNSSIKFFDAFELAKGKAPKTFISKNQKDALPYLNTDFLRINKEPMYVPLDKKSVLADSDDTIILWDGSNAGEILKGKRGVLSSTMVKLKFNKKLLMPEYVYHIIKSKEDEIQNHCQGTGIPHVDRVILGRLDIPSLSLIEQTKLVKQFNSLDNNKNSVQSYIKSIKALRQKLMNELLLGKIRLEK